MPDEFKDYIDTMRSKSFEDEVDELLESARVEEPPLGFWIFMLVAGILGLGLTLLYLGMVSM